MKRFPIGSLGIQQGSTVLFSDFSHGGEMWTGEGPRESRTAMQFDAKFREPPVVHVSITMWDMDHQTNARADLVAETVTTEGFDLVFRTWSDSRIARIRADWMAMGPVRDDDDWDVD